MPANLKQCIGSRGKGPEKIPKNKRLGRGGRTGGEGPATNKMKHLTGKIEAVQSLTKKMKNRVTMVEKGQENDMMMKVVGGAKFIPIDFSDVEGLISKDIIAQHY